MLNFRSFCNAAGAAAVAEAAATTRKCGLIMAASPASVLMPLSTSTSRRALKHTRAIQVEAFARDDGLWDIDARISDIKTSAIAFASGIRPAGAPVHDLCLRVTIDTDSDIVDAQAESDAVAYSNFCGTIGRAYEKLTGLNLMHGFPEGVRQRLTGIHGYTDLTELAQTLPTAAIQAPACDALDAGDGASSQRQAEKPFQLDRRHTLHSDGTAVAQYYPRWAVKSQAVPESS